MVVDCDGCVVRGHGCADCVVTVLLGAPPAGVDLDADERRAIAVLSAGGLVPPLRMLQVVSVSAPLDAAGEPCAPPQHRAAG